MGLMKKLTSALVASSLVLSLVGSAFAAYTPGAGEEAGKRMQDLKIIMGRDGSGDLALNSEITRAELVTTIVRAFGQEETAKYLVGSAIFPDTANHWASGNIAMAVKLVKDAGGDAIGMPDGTFAPDAKLTPAQAVAFLMKFVGVKRDATKAWPNDYLDPAVAANLITAEDKALIAAETGNATRGLTFYLFDNAFYNYKLADGKTFYTKYVSPAGPTLTVTDLPETTMDSKVTVTGNAKGAYEVYVGSQKVTVDASGNFSAEYALPEVKAEPYTVTVTAVDRAGARVEKSDTIARVVGTIATVEAQAITVAAGATVDVAVAAKDEAGNVIADAAITGESAIGTFAGGKFTAGEKMGTGKLTLKAGEVTTTVDVTVTAGALAKVVTSAASVAPGKSVTLVAQDAYGNIITGATFSEESADALIEGQTFVATKAGNYTVKATKDGATATGTVGVFDGIDKLVVTTPGSIVGNGETEKKITVTAVDANGNVVLDFDGDIKLVGLTPADDLIAAENGVATFTVTAEDVLANSDVEILAYYDSDDDSDIETSGADEDDSFSGFISVEPQVATSIKVSADGEYLPTNSRTTPVEVTVDVLDQEGEAMLNGAWEVAVTLTGPASLVDDDDDKTADISITPSANTFDVFPNEAGESGDVTISVSFTGLTSGQDSLKARFAQEPKTIVLTSDDTEVAVDEYTAGAAPDTVKYVEYKIQVVDKNGVPADYDGTLDLVFADVASKAFTYVDIEANGFTAADDLDGNNYAVTVTDGVAYFRVNSQKADTFTVKVVDNDTTDNYSLTASAESSLTFTPASVKYVGMTKEYVGFLQKDNAQVSLTAQLYDRFGNKVAKEGVEVVFTHADYDGVKLNGAGKAAKVNTDANGAATVTASILSYVGDATIDLDSADGATVVVGAYTFDLGNKAYDASEARMALVVPSSVSLEIVSDDTTTAPRLTSVAAGGTVYLKATVKDNYGRAFKDLLTSDFSFEVKDNSGKSGWDAGVSASEWTEIADGVYASVAVTPEKAEALTLTLNVLGQADTITASRAVNVKAGNVAAAQLVEANSDGELNITEDKLAEYTLQLVDAYGNAVSSSQVTRTYYVDLDTSDTAGAFRNANGKDIDYVTIASGRTTAKFFYIGSDETDTLTFTLGFDGDTSDAYDHATEFTQVDLAGDSDETEITLK